VLGQVGFRGVEVRERFDTFRGTRSASRVSTESWAWTSSPRSRS